MSKLGSILTLCCGVVMLTACAHRGKAPVLTSNQALTSAKQNYILGNYEASVDYLRSAACKRSPEAEYALGYLYYQGLGVPKDETRGLALIRLAAADGDCQAIEAVRILADLEGPLSANKEACRRGDSLYSNHQYQAGANNSAYHPSTAELIERSRAQKSICPPQLQERSHAFPEPGKVGSYHGVEEYNHSTSEPTTEQQLNPIQHNTKTIPEDVNTPNFNPAPQGSLGPDTSVAPDAAASAQPLNSSKATQASAGTARPMAEKKSLATVASQLSVLANRWMSKRDAEHCTIQLISDQNEQVIDQYLQAHARDQQFAQQAHKYSYVFLDETWYGVSYGDYATQQDAENTLSSLPKNFYAQKPWIREFKYLQAALIQTEIAPAAIEVAQLEPQNELPMKADLPQTVTETAAKPATKIESAEIALAKPNANYYGIQIFSTYKPEELDKFIQMHKLDPKMLARINYTVNDKARYALIYGKYADLAAAKLALAQIPSGASQTTHPWIKKFAGGENLA